MRLLARCWRRNRGRGLGGWSAANTGLGEKDKLRVLPVLGKEPVQNVIDLLYLKSIDMGLVATDVPEFYNSVRCRHHRPSL